MKRLAVIILSLTGFVGLSAAEDIVCVSGDCTGIDRVAIVGMGGTTVTFTGAQTFTSSVTITGNLGLGNGGGFDTIPGNNLQIRDTRNPRIKIVDTDAAITESVWEVNGSSLLVKFGNLTRRDLHFITQDIPRMRIGQFGEISIGTSAYRGQFSITGIYPSSNSLFNVYFATTQIFGVTISSIALNVQTSVTSKSLVDVGTITFTNNIAEGSLGVLGQGAVPEWELIGASFPLSQVSTISVSFSPRNDIKIVFFSTQASASTDFLVGFNGQYLDTYTLYGVRRVSAATDTSSITARGILVYGGNQTNTRNMQMWIIGNSSFTTKIGNYNAVTAGTNHQQGLLSSSIQANFEWNNTTEKINRVDFVQWVANGVFEEGVYVKVYGSVDSNWRGGAP